MTVRNNLERLRKEIEESSNPQVKLVLVTKYATNEQVKEAYDLGYRSFAENYVKSAIEKMEAINGDFAEEVEWHLIGHLQKNKVKKAVGRFSLIQSVDSEELAKLIDSAAAEKGIRQDILLQINTTGEEQKSGFRPEDFKSSISKLNELNNINIKGLMTIGPSLEQDEEKNPQDLETIFNSLRQLKRELAPEAPELSMGMSDDFQLAIDCGSTMIRLGRVIFENKGKG